MLAGPTRSSPGPMLLKHASTAVRFVSREKSSTETARKLAGEKLPGKNLKRSLQILSGIIEHLDEIDGSINAHSRSWKTSRMPKVDLAIMRLALVEIKYGDDVPEAVAISEAIKLAKKYSTEQSSRFIHGVLGAIVNAPEAAGSAADADSGSAAQEQ